MRRAMLARSNGPGGPESCLDEAHRWPDFAVGAPLYDLLYWGIIVLGSVLTEPLGIG
ncbi:MAG TPA: hypothetical protein VIZ68_06450 [Thermoplasmata archaeon]